MDIEDIKNEGIRKHLFDQVGSALWTAKRATELARETECARFKNFKREVANARRALEEAEQLHAELLKYSR
jgi:cellobiose-specific phosphotransferase system component IIA